MDENGTKNHAKDILDIEKLRLSQKFPEQQVIKRTTSNIDVRKPSKQEFCRTHPNEQFWFTTSIIEFKEARETYLVAPEIREQLSNETVNKVLIPTINRHGVLTLWPIKLPTEDGKLDTWNKSALEAAILAKTKWIRTISNLQISAYEIHEATNILDEPTWPLSLTEMLNIAFKNFYIDDMNHSVIMKLNGEI